jgi:MtN3 and saliva related transmembrane protein
MSETQIVFWIGICAGTCTTLSFIPQGYEILKCRSAIDISGTMYSLFSLGSLLWLLYGIGSHSLPVILANAVTLALNLSILFLKWKFSRLTAGTHLRRV